MFPGRDSAGDPEVERQLLAVSRYVESERVCGQFFTKDAAAVARIYVPEYSGPCLHVANMAAAPTSVAFDSAGDGTFGTAVTGYDLARYGDRNAHLGSDPKPWNEIWLPSYAVGAQSVGAGQRWQVTAQWGWAAVPEAVRLGVIHITALVLLQSPRATTRIDELGNTIGMSAQASNIINELLLTYPRQPVIA